MSKNWKSITVLSAMLGLLPAVVYSSVDFNGEPVAIISQIAGSLLSTLEENRAEFELKPELMRDVVRSDLIPMIDLKYSSRLILGKTGRNLSPEQLTAFSEAMVMSQSVASTLPPPMA